MDLKYRQNEIERKIGRNLLLIQQTEHCLKYIVLNSKISGNPSQLKDIQKTREKKLSKNSMGQTLDQYLNHINPSEENNQEKTNFEIEPLHISYEINFDISKEEFEKKEKLLSVILEERNNLVHHFIVDLDVSSIDSYKEIEIKLDEQRDFLLPELKDLQSKSNAIEELLKPERFKRVLKDSYYLDMVENFPLIVELANISMEKHRLDGWVSLGLAGSIIRQNIPDEVEKLKEKYASKTLKSLISERQIFEIKEDVSKNMILYKLVPEWKEYFEQVSWKKVHPV